MLYMLEEKHVYCVRLKVDFVTKKSVQIIVYLNWKNHGGYQCLGIPSIGRLKRFPNTDTRIACDVENLTVCV
jgi:hypothetical protein